ncbi:DNA polymerase III gamma and tau subunits DnaX [Cyanobacterium sp. HL-69]|uniref:DNA polymerase III subunit gamma/tau n=1 Tax=Cyanobacterium sp. HL-69 TaxID=2054282 RepID=UPI000CA328CC|nr:DNA polymerase III gamma and tau subunits DnaX [Cyanobacterium sp. HL-69]
MTYEPLHHKYRPQTFAQLAGQDAIAQTLSNALTSGRIAPAYLFCGPRGTGKTSSARILAKSLNCMATDKPTPTPCGKCEACVSITNGSALDVIEIDAASNTGVDNIREIIERVQFAPVQCRYKVYVIDECHMLSTAAFNALLKTLEEPPSRVIFVLATTDPQRVLPTIISRCQRFDYRRIPLDAMVKHLRYIATEESIDIDSGALSLVAQLSNGGMRDAESLLDQLSLLSGTITTQKVWDLVGSVSEQDLLELLNAIASDNSETAIVQCRKLLDRGREPLILLQNLANFYLSLLIAKTAPGRSDLVTVTEETWQKLCQTAQHWHIETILQGQKKLKDSEFQIKNTTQPRLWLEITLLNLLPSANRVVTTTNAVVTPTPIAPSSPTPTAQKKVSPTPPVANESQPSTIQPQQPSPPETPTPPITSNLEFTSLEELKEKVAVTIESVMTKSFLLQQCSIIDYQSTVITIGVIKEIFLKLSKQHQPAMEKAFSQVLGKSINLVFQVEEKETKKKSSDNSPPPAVEKIVEYSPPPPIKTPSVEEKEEVINLTPQPVVADSDMVRVVSPAQLKQVAEKFAKSVNGEIIDDVEPPLFIIPAPEIKVINRPPLDIEDDEDLPF